MHPHNSAMLLKLRSPFDVRHSMDNRKQVRRHQDYVCNTNVESYTFWLACSEHRLSTAKTTRRTWRARSASLHWGSVSFAHPIWSGGIATDQGVSSLVCCLTRRNGYGRWKFIASECRTCDIRYANFTSG
jgi:hypothetical protein